MGFDRLLRKDHLYEISSHLVVLGLEMTEVMKMMSRGNMNMMNVKVRIPMTVITRLKKTKLEILLKFCNFHLFSLSLVV